MTNLELPASTIEMHGLMLAHLLETTEADRLDWHPSADPQSKSRSALDIADECIGINRYFAAILSGRSLPAPTEGRSFSTVEEAKEQVKQSARELAEVVRGLDEAALERIYEARRPLPGVTILRFATSHTSYHIGQINYIQTLYGDTEFRVPPELIP